MEDFTKFVEMKVKEEPMDHQGSSSHFPSSSGVDGVRSHSVDVKEEDVSVKDEPIEEVDPIAVNTTTFVNITNFVNTTTFTPNPESTWTEDSAQHGSKPHIAGGSTAPLHVATSVLPQEPAADQDDSGSDTDKAAKLEGNVVNGSASGTVPKAAAQGPSGNMANASTSGSVPKAAAQGPSGTAAGNSHTPGPSGYRPAPRRRPMQPDKYMKLLFPMDGNDEISDSEFVLDSDIDSDSDSDFDSDSDSDSVRDNELIEGEDNHRNREVPLLETPNFSFAWSEGSDFVPDLHEFCSDRSGVTRDWPCNDQATESDFFRAYLDDELMSFVADQTNDRYRSVCEGMNGLPPTSRARKWEDTTAREMIVFIALVLLMPLCKKHDVQEYWRNDRLCHALYGDYMTRDRFLLLLGFLNFSNNENSNDNGPLRKVKEIISMFVARYKKYFHPFQKLVIDESLVLHKGRLSIKQYIPTKRHRLGIKLFVLCDCYTGIVLDMIVYAGGQTDIPTVNKKDPMGKSGAIVRKMMAPYFGKGHILYMDNWYTSPALCQFLHDTNTGSCGTTKKNRKFMPKFNGQKTIVDDPSRPLNDDTARSQGRNGRKKDLYVQKEKAGKILALKWSDKRDVHLLSTVHTGAMVYTGKRHCGTKKEIWKPDVVHDYTMNMRLVDKCDSQISGIECMRRATRWPVKMFFHLVDMTMVNAYNMWLVTHESTPTKRIMLRRFAYNVAIQLLEQYGEQTPTIMGRRPADLPFRLQPSTRHYPVHTEIIDGRRVGRQCYVCKHTTRRPPKRTRITIKCNECNVPLCVGDCFRDFHNRLNF